MLSLLSYIYKFFQHNITTKIPEVKSVDLFFNQFETQNEGGSDGRANPRILIEIEEFEPIQSLGKVQVWEGEVTLHIGIDVFNTFASDSELLDKNLAYLNLLDSIYQQLSFTSTNDLPDDLKSEPYQIYQVERSNVLFAINPEAIKVSQIKFRYKAEDYSLTTVQETGTINSYDLELNFETS